MSAQPFQVTSDYTVIDRSPLRLALGQRVKVGRKDEDWPGWVWIKVEDGRGSYVPEEIISETGKVTQDFSGRDLSVRRQEVVQSLWHVRGWHWCKNHTGDEGWLPEYLLKPITAEEA